MHLNNKVEAEKEKISLNSLKKDHQDIEREIKEIETILMEDEVNRSNFLHVFRKLCNMWDSHELKERRFLEKIADKKIDITIDKNNNFLPLNNLNLKGHKKVIQLAAQSGSELKLKVALDTDGRMLINKLRNEIRRDNQLFDKLK